MEPIYSFGIQLIRALLVLHPSLEGSLPSWGIEFYLLRYIRYGCVLLWVTFDAPWVFISAGLVGLAASTTVPSSACK